MPFEKAKTLRDVRRQAQVEPLPADDPRYVPLDDVRGKKVVTRLLRLLEDDEECVHLAYAGHRGSGKTTELFRLIKELEKKGVFCVYFDAHPELNMGDIEYTDILLYIAQKVVAVALEHVELNNNVLEAVVNYFVEVTKIDKEEVKTEASLESSAKSGFRIPFIVDLLMAINARISGSSSHAKELRTNLQKRPDQLIENVNILIEHVRDQLKTIGKNKLVLILDSLDRLQAKAIQAAVVDHARVYTQLRINLILTVPLASIYLPKGETLDSQGMKLFVLPMVAVRDKNQPWDEVNKIHIEELKKLITMRIDTDIVFEDESIVHEMVLLSGGSFRELFELVGESALEADALPITKENFELASKRVWSAFKAPLKFDDRKYLVDIHREKECDHREESFQLLFHRFALEYNGEGWADVHPLIMRFDTRFKQQLGTDR